LFKQSSKEHLGGDLDFVLHSIGMSPNVRKGKGYDELNYDWYKQTLDISAVSFHRMLQAASNSTGTLAEHASVVALSYIAAQRVFPGYGDMADAKALLESIARSWGYYLGMSKKVRVNTVSQSPTKTTAGAGIKGFGGFYGFAQEMSPLGNAPAEDCAPLIASACSAISRATSPCRTCSTTAASAAAGSPPR
jgi:enoyl-[acyl-carrier protein] reductase I